MKRSNSLKGTKCTACDAEAFARFEGVPYCKKHYMQMYHKGKITTRTIYDPNEYILHDDYAECITYDKEGNETARVKVNLDKVEELKQYKVYIRKQGGKVIGVNQLRNGKWVARIMHNYQTINLGNYDNAIIARLTKELELCGDYGPNKDLYHLLGHCSNAREQA